MDQWDFKKWRKKLGINQFAAGEMLGLSRGAVQDWESEIRPVYRGWTLFPLAIWSFDANHIRTTKAP